MNLPKFSGPDLDDSREFAHADVWQREVYPTWSRLIIGAREQEISLILDLCRGMQGPFGVLYVLLVSRQGHQHGRYQNPTPIGRDELELFLYSFQDFFEQDGRHHLWVTSTSGEGQVIFDNHNVLYAYGEPEIYERILRGRGFREDPVRTPAPHSHNYHEAFDACENEVLGYWNWKRFPLKDSDDP
jgi:hypothetical protein